MKKIISFILFFSILFSLSSLQISAAGDSPEVFTPSLTNKMNEKNSGNWSQSSYSRAVLTVLLFVDALGEYRFDFEEYSNGLLSSYVAKENYNGYDFYVVTIQGENDILLIEYIPDLSIGSLSTTSWVSSSVMISGLKDTYDLLWENDEDNIIDVVTTLSSSSK